MKSIFISITFLLSAILISCDKEAAPTELNEINSSAKNQFGSGGSSLEPCSAYEPSTMEHGVPAAVTITVRYQSYLTLEEIDCIRREYFENFICLRMAFIQPTDPYLDWWKTEYCRPGDEEDVIEEVDEDGRLDEN